MELHKLKDLRGGSFENFLQALIKKIRTDRALKIAIFSLFVAMGTTYFNKEVETFLSDDLFKLLDARKVETDLKIVYNIIDQNDLTSYTQSIRSLILNSSEKFNR